jgi:hypothetical protein
MRTLLIAATAALAAVASGYTAYHQGVKHGAASVVCPPPKIIRGNYSTEELHRMIRARKRMEAVK